MTSKEYEKAIEQRLAMASDSNKLSRLIGMCAYDLRFLEELKSQLNAVNENEIAKLQYIIKDTADRISLLINTYTNEKYKF